MTSSDFAEIALAGHMVKAKVLFTFARGENMFAYVEINGEPHTLWWFMEKWNVVE